VAPDGSCNETHDKSERNCQNHNRNLRLTEHVTQHAKIKQIANDEHDDDGQATGEIKIQPHKGFIGEPEAQKSAEHHEVALGKVHRFRGLVNQHKTQSDQPINTTVSQTANYELDEIQLLSPYYSKDAGFPDLP